MSHCRTLSQIASQIMRRRQTGAAMSDMMDSYSKDPALVQLVLAAYVTNRMRAESNQETAAVDFGNEVYRACYSEARPGR